MPVLKELNLVGTSAIGWQEAVREAVKTASDTVRHIEEVEVVKLSARVAGSDLIEYRAEVKVAFLVEH